MFDFHFPVNVLEPLFDRVHRRHEAAPISQTATPNVAPVASEIDCHVEETGGRQVAVEKVDRLIDKYEQLRHLAFEMGENNSEAAFRAFTSELRSLFKPV